MSNQWKKIPSLEIARSHPSVASYNGKVYVFGGGGPNFKSLNSVVCFDPKTDNWSNCADMPTRRSGTMATTVGDSIYVMGGGFKQEDGTFRFLTTVEIYHPDSDTWTKGPDLIMPHDYPAVAFLNNALYILGGHHPDATKGGPKTDPGFNFCERLVIGSDHWEEIAPLQVARFALSAIAQEGKIFAMGGVAFRPEGFDNFTTIEVYDPATNSWSQSDDFTLPWPAAGLGSALLNEQLYVYGGFSSDDIHTRSAVYQPETNSWELTGPLPSPVAAMGTAVCEGKIYSFGGWADDGRTPIYDAFCYTP